MADDLKTFAAIEYIKWDQIKNNASAIADVIDIMKNNPDKDSKDFDSLKNIIDRLIINIAEERTDTIINTIGKKQNESK